MVTYIYYVCVCVCVYVLAKLSFLQLTIMEGVYMPGMMTQTFTKKLPIHWFWYLASFCAFVTVDADKVPTVCYICCVYCEHKTSIDYTLFQTALVLANW